MKITSADIYYAELFPGLNPVILRLRTDEGIEGASEVGLAYGVGGRAGARMVEEMVERFLVGSDPSRIEATWHTLFRRTFWGQGGGPVVYGAMSAIDIALWDIRGKALGLPVCDILGGRTSDDLRVYANGWFHTWTRGHKGACNAPEEFAEAALSAVADGYDALKFDPFVMWPDGVSRPPERVLPRAQADLAYERVRAVREAVGSHVDIMVEVHGNLGTASAIEMGQRLAELKPYFYEEPVDAMNVECMLKVSQNVPIPIAAGERLYTRYGFREYIEKQAIDILQPDIGLAGGITELKKIAAMAETYDLHVQPHRYAGPLTTAASVQLDPSITNFCIQEWHPYLPQAVYDLVEDAFERHASQSRFQVPDKPGLGATLNEKALAGHPCIHIE